MIDREMAKDYLLRARSRLCGKSCPKGMTPSYTIIPKFTFLAAGKV